MWNSNTFQDIFYDVVSKYYGFFKDQIWINQRIFVFSGLKDISESKVGFSPGF